MALFPQIDNLYYTSEDRSVHEMVEYFYASSIQINQSFWSEADIDSRFRAGDQTLWNDIYGNMPAFRRRQFNFNRIRRVCNMITGYQRQHRKNSMVTAVHPTDQATSDQLSKALFWANQNSNTLEILSQAFDGSITTGMNLLSVWMDYREDPINGTIRVDNSSYNEYLIDPFFKKHDLSDCRFVWKRQWLSKTEIKSLMSDHIEEIDGMYARGWRDGKFQFQPEAYNYAMQDLLSYDEFDYMDYRKRKLLVDTETGDTLEWESENPEMLELYRRTYPSIRVVDQIVPSVKKVILVNGKVMYHGLQPSGLDCYMHVPVMAYYDPQIPYFPWRIQGVVRGLRDSQYLYNRRKIIELDILESQVNSGIKYKEDSLVNPKDAFLQGQGRSLALKKTAQMDDVQTINAPAIPESMIALSELLGKEIEQISGVNEELLGSAVDDKAGILSMLRQGAGLTTLQILFDQLDNSQKYLGNIYLQLMQKNFTEGKFRRILGEEPTADIRNKTFLKYNCIVEDGVLTSTQQQMAFTIAFQLKQAGIMIPDKYLVDKAVMQDKQELIEDMEAERKQLMEQQQQNQKAINDEIVMRTKLAEASILEKQGLAAERFSRVSENESLSIERKAQATYDEIRAIKELQGMDMDTVHKLITMLGDLKQIQANEEKSINTTSGTNPNAGNPPNAVA
jgi:hypothetical protein